MKQTVRFARDVQTLAALGLTLMLSIARAEPGLTTTDPKAMAPAVAAPGPPLVTGDFAVNVTNEYISRGLVLVNHGVQIQPAADVFFHVFQGDGFINSVTPTLGVWSDLTTDDGHGASQPGHGPSHWYEFDTMPGVAVGFAKNWTLTETYLQFNSPSGGFKTARSMNTCFGFNDAGLLDPSKNFSLQPHFTWLAELPAPGSAGLRKDGNYFELGLAPNYTILKRSEYPVTFTVPLTLGLGDDNFYHGDTYGYFTTGLSISTPLAFLPASLGAWTASVGYKYYNLGDQAAKTLAVTRDQDVYSFSIGCSF
jgi:hypothetical protein